MATIAVFPLAFFRQALEWHRQNYVDNSGTFSYERRQKMSPAVVFATRDYSFVHCGDSPLIAWCGVQATKRFNVVASCYVDDKFSLVFPG